MERSRSLQGSTSALNQACDIYPPGCEKEDDRVHKNGWFMVVIITKSEKNQKFKGPRDKVFLMRSQKHVRRPSHSRIVSDA